LECGGKRSATPPWILLRKPKSGVALRLPPHSKGFQAFIETAPQAGLDLPRHPRDAAFGFAKNNPRRRRAALAAALQGSKPSLDCL
jgi:hypothetical protein